MNPTWHQIPFTTSALVVILVFCILPSLVDLIFFILPTTKIRKQWKTDWGNAIKAGQQPRLPSDWRIISRQYFWEMLFLTIFGVIIPDTWIMSMCSMEVKLTIFGIPMTGVDVSQVVIGLIIVAPLTLANIWQLFVRGKWWTEVIPEFHKNMAEVVEPGQPSLLWQLLAPWAKQLQARWARRRAHFDAAISRILD